MEISDRSVRRMVETELGLKPYKLQKVEILTEKTKLVRLRRCRKLLSQRWERLLFTDEKLFAFQRVHNSQNDRIWCVDAPSTSAIVQHCNYSKSDMVWS
ncbi:DDE_3 domain-containing protein [Trichonephila clavipes]|nr:DDE_3 domain-containing protein [Trichonephila clavipes]